MVVVGQGNVEGYTYVGLGNCLDSNNESYPYVDRLVEVDYFDATPWLTETPTVVKCGALCDSFKDEIYFRGFHLEVGKGGW